MKAGVRRIELTEQEHGILIRCLNDKRTELIKQDKDTNVVNDLLLKLIDAPTKKRERSHEER